MTHQSIPFPANSHFGQRFGLHVEAGPVPNSQLMTVPTHPLGMYRVGRMADANAHNTDRFVAPDGVTPVLNGYRKMVTPPLVAVGDRIYIGIWHRKDVMRGGNFIMDTWDGGGGIFADWLDYSNLVNGAPTVQTIMLGDPAVMVPGSGDAELLQPLAVGAPGQPTNEDLHIYYRVDTAPTPGTAFEVVLNLKDSGE